MSQALAVLRRDPAFRPLIEKVGTLELRSRRPYFWVLCTAILAQQVSGGAARSIIGKVRALYPDRRFPDPRSILDTPERGLQACGVSRQKRRYLYALAGAFARCAGPTFSPWTISGSGRAWSGISASRGRGHDRACRALASLSHGGLAVSLAGLGVGRRTLSHLMATVSDR